MVSCLGKLLVSRISRVWSVCVLLLLLLLLCRRVFTMEPEVNERSFTGDQGITYSKAAAHMGLE